MLTFGYLRIENQEIAIAKAELLCEISEGYIIRLVAEFVGGGFFGFCDVELPLLKSIPELAEQRIHIEWEADAFEDDTLGTDWIGADDTTDLNCLYLSRDRYYKYGEIIIDFLGFVNNRCQIQVEAYLAHLSDDAEIELIRANCPILARLSFEAEVVEEE